jgi:hypothetical protein
MKEIKRGTQVYVSDVSVDEAEIDISEELKDLALRYNLKKMALSEELLADIHPVVSRLFTLCKQLSGNPGQLNNKEVRHVVDRIRKCRHIEPFDPVSKELDNIMEEMEAKE